eukprot:scaffold210076_cov23-Cyclotella_meneghiniana.AAC.1
MAPGPPELHCFHTLLCDVVIGDKLWPTGHMIETIGMVSDVGRQSEMNASFWCIHPPLRLDSEKQS